MKASAIPILIILLLISCKNSNDTNLEENKRAIEEVEEKNLTDADRIAKAYGIDKWNDVEEIKFVFNVSSPDGPPTSRRWKWNPKSGDVAMSTADKTVNYNRSSVDSSSLKADQAFINDKYWLLAPFQLKWDDGTTLSEPTMTTTPIDSLKSKKLTITYGSSGGYTPGDAYDYYYGDDYKIKQWVFRKGNDSLPSLTTTWENEQTIKGITFARDHKIPNTERNIYFTDIEIKLVE